MTLSDEAKSNASALARLVASHGLRQLPEMPVSIDEQTWSVFAPMVDLHRLSGLLAQCVLDETIDLDDASRAQALHLHRQATMKVLSLDRLLLEAADVLASRGIGSRILKGCAHASLLYAEPSWRTYGDVDLLVHGRQFSAAVAALEENGLVRPNPELGSRFDERFGKGATLRTDDGLGLDLHRTFLAGPIAFLIDPEALFARAEIVTVAGTELRALGREEALLHACLHSTLSDNVPRLISIRDVAEGCRNPAVNLDRLLELAGEWKVRVDLSSALTQAWRVLVPDHTNWLVEWAGSYRPGAREARLMRAYTGSQRRWARQAAAAVTYIPGVRNKASYLWSLSAVARRRLLRR